MDTVESVTSGVTDKVVGAVADKVGDLVEKVFPDSGVVPGPDRADNT